MAGRHGGPLPAAGLVLGGALMAVLLFGQGRLGLLPPRGDGGSLTAVAPAYLPRRGHLLLAALLAAAMVGWNGFNVGMGGASLSALLHAPPAVGPVLLAAAVVAVSYASPRAGNRIAVVTTLCAFSLVVVCVLRLAPPVAPVRLGVDGPVGTAADAAALAGYVAVFAVRAPDFSAGLTRRRDLAWCVALLVVPALAVAVAGACVWLRTGSADVVTVLAAAPGLAAYANLFVAVAVFAPALTTTYSATLALRGLLPRVPASWGILLVAVPGLALAVLRFDRHLLGWLTVLGALLPPLVAPMAVEAWRRTRGRAARTVPTWTWLPAGGLGCALTAAGRPAAPLAGLAAAALATALYHARGRRHDVTSIGT